jgi:D-alanyl-lipoteichoic acid acyltransferase DltB (MBOAT superfamily)
LTFGPLAGGALVTLFTIGLAKKTLIADNLAPFSDAVFAAAHHGTAIGMADAWMGTLFFAFQIYFDFSGYSDMALGSACMFGIRLPMNFNSPYKAASIIEFWRLWHISLSTFLRDYLYIPLGGNRHGRFRRYANLFITMLLGGLWHGAGWTFVIWGGLHGVYLIVNHAFRALTRGFTMPRAFKPVAHAASVFVTFVAVVFAWTVFRAESFDGAARMISGLAGAGGSSHLLTFGPLASSALTLLFALIWFTPNSMEITWRLKPALETRYRDAGLRKTRWQWRPSRATAVVFGLLFVVSVMALSNLSPFIYFQF